ncbi:MAG: hypothetical protein CMM44_00220 [Rhodospirillaceae bacterium]|nr:hypothetical protein [Rhodospirillaceae bacterium]
MVLDHSVDASGQQQHDSVKRVITTPRSSLRDAALKHQFEFSLETGIPFWDESAYYTFSHQQIEEHIIKSAENIENMCFQVVERAITDETIFQKIGIDRCYWDLIANSWNDKERNLLGRMDFAYNGKGLPKLLEYNADTPTTLYESSIFQWEWFEESIDQGLLSSSGDQFNNIHEKIVEAFKTIGIESILHLTANKDIEDDWGTIEYIADCAIEAGLLTHLIDITDIGLGDDDRFSDTDGKPIAELYKLYPWEWILAEEFGKNVYRSQCKFIEPPWRCVLSNKGLLPILWEMFEGHPNLLPAYFTGDPEIEKIKSSSVKKPIFGRQGANIAIERNGQIIDSRDGPYTNGPFIKQEFYSLPDFKGHFPVVGCWVVASRAVGLGVREDTNLITGNKANFIPHIVEN